MYIPKTITLLILFYWNTASASEEEYLTVYRYEDISSCEARNLATLWNKSHHETAIEIGRQISEGRDLTEEILLAGSKENSSRCSWGMMDVLESDLDLLAQHWSVSYSEAKIKIAEHVHQNTFREMKKLIHRIRPKNPIREDYTPLQRFRNSSFDRCHAKMLRKNLNKTLRESKIWMGTHVKDNPEKINEELQAVRKNRADNPQCSYHETPFTYEDAPVLANLWSVTKKEAKLKVEQAYQEGTEKNIFLLLKKN